MLTFDPEIKMRKAVIVHCAECGFEWAPCVAPIPIDDMVKAMKKRGACPLCGCKKAFMGEKARPSVEGDYEGWLLNGDTGSSSCAIWTVCSGQTIPNRLRPTNLGAPPFDPADFGRCERLLRVMPSWRSRLGEVAERWPEGWSALVSAWPELVALYEAELPSGTAPKLYARMKELLGEPA